MMGVPEMRALVKNTFLEFVETPEDEEEQPRITTSQTDSKALGIWNCRDGVASPEDDTKSRASRAGLAKAADAADPDVEDAALCADAAADADDVAAAAQVVGETTLGCAESTSSSEPAAQQPQQPPKPLPDLDVGFQVLVKNTFLELVEEDEPQGKITRSSTDSLAMLRCEGWLGDRDPFRSGRFLASSGKAGEAAAPQAAAAEAAADMPVLLGAKLRVPGMTTIAEEACSPAARSPAAKDQPSQAAVLEGAGHVREDAAVDDKVDQLPRAVNNGPTTLMLRNVPNDYTRSMVLELLDTTGFANRYNFIYYPTDFSRRAGLGYAFVNMLEAEDARQLGIALEGFRRWSVPSGKVCSISWNVPCQGLEANIERYRNSPIMHKCVPDEFKPALFQDGVRAPFPKPTRKIRRPDMRRGGC